MVANIHFPRFWVATKIDKCCVENFGTPCYDVFGSDSSPGDPATQIHVFCSYSETLVALWSQRLIFRVCATPKITKSGPEIFGTACYEVFGPDSSPGHPATRFHMFCGYSECLVALWSRRFVFRVRGYPQNH